MDIQLTIPMPLQIIVDDVGWWRGEDGSQRNQPYRTGIDRDHTPADYLALARLGKALDMRILAGFVLCEWDKSNILRKLPSATWMGTSWKNKKINHQHWEQAAEIIMREKASIEIALHGVGHEYWHNGKMERAEFHDEHCQMRERDEIRRHLEFFLRLMEQHNFSSSPTTFIPPALKHSFGNGDDGFQKLLHEFGIKYVATRFDKARQFAEPLHPKLTWENKVLLADRGKSESAWNAIGCNPAFAFDGPFLPLHWANILHPDPEKNNEVIDKWIVFIRDGARKHRFLLARDMHSCLIQYLHVVFAVIDRQDSDFSIDLTWKKNIPHNLYDSSFFVELSHPPSMEFRISGGQAKCAAKDNNSSLLHITPFQGIAKILISSEQKL
jgi:hypothetical protein